MRRVNLWSRDHSFAKNYLLYRGVIVHFVSGFTL